MNCRKWSLVGKVITQFKTLTKINKFFFSNQLKIEERIYPNIIGLLCLGERACKAFHFNWGCRWLGLYILMYKLPFNFMQFLLLYYFNLHNFINFHFRFSKTLFPTFHEFSHSPNNKWKEKCEWAKKKL